MRLVHEHMYEHVLPRGMLGSPSTTAVVTASPELATDVCAVGTQCSDGLSMRVHVVPARGGVIDFLRHTIVTIDS
jgi:hypothetical protein